MLILAAAAVLTAETSRPRDSVFALGEKVEATFSANGLVAGETRTLTVRIEDDEKVEVGTKRCEMKADGNGTWTKTLELPAKRYGFYRVWADAGKDLTIPKTGSRPAGCLTYAVVIDPLKRRVPAEEDCFCGMFGGDWEESPERRPFLTWLGMRVAFSKDTPKPGRPRRAIEAPGGFVTYGGSATSGHGLENVRPFFTEEGKAWSKRFGLKLIWDIFSRNNTEGKRHFADGVLAYAKAAQAQLPEGRKRLVLEYFSEPDLLSPKPEYIVEAAKIIWETVHPALPDALIVQPGLSTITALGYHRKLFDLGLGQYMNAFHVHPYTGYPPEQNDYLENVRAIKKMVADGCGGRDIPLFAFEAGANLPWTKDQEQMAGQIRCMLMLLGEGFKANFGFHPSDYGSDGGEEMDGDYGYTYNLDLPSHRYDPTAVSPRPIFAAAAGFSQLLDGFRPVVCLDTLGGTAMGYAYANAVDAKEVLLAVWDYGGKKTKTVLDVGRKTIRLSDVFGNARTVETRGGRLEVELGLKPVFVLGVDPALWGKDGRETAKNGKGFAKVAPPLAAVSERVGFNGKTPLLMVSVANTTDKPAEATVSTRLGVPEARCRGALKVPANGRAEIVFRLEGFSPDPFKVFELETTVEDVTGVATVRKSRVNFLAAERVENFAVWKPAFVPYREIAFFKGEKGYNGPKDLSVDLGVGWNKKYLMFAFDVSDDCYKQDDIGFRTFLGDCIQLGLAKRILEKTTANDKTDRHYQAMSELNFALTKMGPEIYRAYSFDDDFFPSGSGGPSGIVPISECPFTVEKKQREDGGFILSYRMAIPWRYLLVENPKAGDNVLFAALVNDLDADSKILSMVEVFKTKEGRPRKFGRIVLMGH